MGPWLFLGFVAALWSVLAFGLFRLLGGGSAPIFEIGRALGYAPAAIQELADRIAEAGPAGQILVAVVWLAGLGLIAFIGFQLSQPPRRD